MNYTCVDTAEFLYPDITEYQSGTDRVHLLTPRGSFACTQILFSGVSAKTLNIRFEGFEPEVYEMVPIFVEENHLLDETNSHPHIPERVAPYYVYDCLKPVKNSVTVGDNGVSAIYLSEKIPCDAKIGTRYGKIIVDDIEIPVEIEVSSAVVPDESLVMIQGYSQDCVCKYHNVEYGTDKFEELDTKYLKMLRRMRQNMLYCPRPDAKDLGNNKYEISFANMESFINKAMALGFEYFNFGLGFRRNWNESTILVNGMESMSLECYCYLAEMLPALENFLKEKGLLDKFYLGVADEPNEANATEHRALSGLIRKFAPSIKLMDAMHYGPVHGSIDIWILLSSDYQEHKNEVDIYSKYGDEIWYYDCNNPRGGKTINRFLDYALLATRYHLWAAYRYNLKGYLHWAANCYQPGQNPFTESCPEHRNADYVCHLPPGDTHIIYPGESEPWMSVRLEAYRASAEEYELFKLLSKTNKEKADEICRSVCREFDDVDYSPLAFREARNKLIRALEEQVK
ncbi:MAG: DUF4091 domain-containing protein [Clostridia bacterium]|nr:DUF4091 domain-containing protein [Clostridia bacterium]